MSVRSSAAPRSRFSAVVPFLEYLVVGVLGLVALGWFLERTGHDGESAVRDVEADVVVVHVTEPDVEVVVGGRSYQIEGWARDPIVCKLPSGRHDLMVIRDGELLYREMFTVREGEGVVLTAWNPNRTRERPNAGSRP